MSDRYTQLLDLAVSQYARAEELHAQSLTSGDIRDSSTAADGFRAAARFLHSALVELDPTAPELPEFTPPATTLHRPIGQTAELAAIADHHA